MVADAEAVATIGTSQRRAPARVELRACARSPARRSRAFSRSSTRQGSTLAPLLSSASMSRDAVRTASRIDWDTFVTLVEGLEPLCGDRLSLEQLALQVYQAASLSFLRHAGHYLVSPRQLYRVAHRMVAPAMFSNVTVKQAWLPSGRLEIEGELEPGYSAWRCPPAREDLRSGSGRARNRRRRAGPDPGPRRGLAPALDRRRRGTACTR